jgi:hypothetical protein
MGDNQKRILQMLAEGKISVEEASRLLSLVNEEKTAGERPAESDTGKINPKYLYVRVEPKEGFRNSAGKGGPWSGEHGRVNVRIPVGLIRAGMKLKALIPPHVADEVNQALHDKGLDFDIRDLKDEYLEELIKALGETEISVDSEQAEVRIHTG